MGERYPGSPVEAGKFHPLIDMHMATTKGNEEAFHIGMEVAKIMKAVEREISSGQASAADSLADVPAADRMIDLATIGLMVERGILRIPAFAEDDLSKGTLTAETNAEIKRCLEENDEDAYDRLSATVHTVTLTVPVTSAAAVVSALRYAGTWPMQKVHNMIIPQIDLQIQAARVARGLSANGSE